MDPLYLALLLYLAAVALAIVDVFVPSAGMLLAMTVLAALGAVLFGFRSSYWMGMAMLTMVIASVPVFVFVAIRVWPHTPLGRLIILKQPDAEPADATSLEVNQLQELVGHVLLAEMAFLPGGQVRVGYRRFNALAESGFIEAGSRVRVLAVRERNLIVRATDDPLTDAAAIFGSDRSAGHSTLTHRGPERAQVDSSGSGGNLLDRPAEELGLDSLEN